MIRLLSRRCLPVLVGLATLAVALLASSAALAAAPETPETLAPTAVTASTATLQGVLNPGKEGPPLTFELDTYEFLYKQSSSTCEGESKAPEPSGISLGGGMEMVAQEVSGLQANTEYTVCLLARVGSKGETAVGPAVTFRTALPPETPETKPADEVTAEGATLHGVLNPTAPGDAGEFWFVYRRSASECQGSGERTTSEQPANGQQGENVEAKVAGLLPGATYTFCLRARNAARESALGQPQTFTTSASVPTIASEEYSGVNSSEALVSAVIDTNGTPTTYRVEYGPSAAYGSSTPEASAGAASEPTRVQVSLTGLHSATAYHFRFVATYGGGSAEGADLVFSTLAPGIQGLPDGRGYEMVTPSSNENAEVYVPDNGLAGGDYSVDGIGTYGIFESATDGDSVAYVGSPTSTGNGLSGGALGNQFLATRSPGGGWTQQDVQPRGYMTPEYQAFSSDLTRGMVSSCDNALPPLAPNAPKGYDVLYRHTIGSGPYEPVFTVKPPNRPPGEAFRSFNVEIQYGWCDPENIAFAGASANYEQLLFVANDALTPNAVDGGEEENNLYDSVDGHLSLVNVLPDGTTEPNATFGGPQLPYEGSTTQDAPDFDHVISADGSRVFWTDLNSGDLYMRENATQPQSPLGPAGECTVPSDACTVQIDASRGPGSGGGGRFWAATGDGSEVFFTDCNRLTSNSTAVAGGGCGHVAEGGAPVLTGNDLYEYDTADGQLVDLTVDHSAGDALGADVQGVLAASETVAGTGPYVYFVADGVLSEGGNAAGERPSAGEPNLYVNHGGETDFIATLSPLDGVRARPFGGANNGDGGDWEPQLGRRTAEATPEGRQLVFMSQLSLTGYQNRGYSEVYRYDAATHGLTCVSCNPSSEPAHGDAYVPISWSDTYITPWMSADGSRVFFDSPEALVASDGDGNTDVYEWESAGKGSCTEGPSCLYLISSGTSTANSLLAAVSPSGDDAFFISRSQLVPQDGNQNFNLFDARVGVVAPPTLPVCSGTGCQGVPPAPPIFATPASATFAGVGDFVPQTRKARNKPVKCKRGSVRKSGRCLRRRAKHLARGKRAGHRSSRRSEQRRKG